MNKFIIILFSIILLVFSYQIRIGFLNAKDYNEPSDGREYLIATTESLRAIRNTQAINDLKITFPSLIQALDTHSAPATIAYYTIARLISSENLTTTNAILSSIFIVVLFLVISRIFPLWIAIFISSIASIYTPIFAYIYSYMPESFGGFFVPTFSFLAVFIATRKFRSRIFVILTGIILGLIALYRIEFRWIGIPFVIAWFIVQPKRKNILPAILMFGSYTIIVLGWFLLSHFFNQSPYYNSGNIIPTLYNAYNWKTFGWEFDTAPVVRDWGVAHILKFIIFQNPLHFIWLNFARVIRLWLRPATVYVGEYFISDNILFFVHSLVIGSALFGLRRMFFDKKLLLLGVIIVWVSFFSFAPEELRRQIPLIGIMLLFAAAGVYEFFLLFKTDKNKLIFFSLILIFFLHLLDPQLVFGSMIYIFPFVTNISFLRIFFILIEVVILLSISKKLYVIDMKQKFIFSNKFLKRVPSLIPLLLTIILVSYQLYSPSWHQFSTQIPSNNRIQQIITIDQKARSFIKDKDGYVLIDLVVPLGDNNFEVLLNNQKLTKRLPLNKSMDTITLLVHRQFQRNMPRLGWGHMEESVATSSAFPNMHQWLIFPIQGDILKEINTITVKSKSVYSDGSPIIYGDFFSSYNKNYYDGPTARIFQGPQTFLKFQVDGDRRLPETSILESVKNVSEFYIEGIRQNDLSTSFGKQTGRYRIFFLFPYRSEDPESLF